MARKKGKKMSEVIERPGVVQPPVDVEKAGSAGRVEISGGEDGQDADCIYIFVRSPKVAEVVRKMATGNYLKEHVDKGYAACLQDLVETPEMNDKQKQLVKEGRIVTRPALKNISTNLSGSAADSTMLDFDKPPCTLLLSNPDALATGYTIKKKLDKPVPPEVFRRWGKQLLDAMADIMKHARPFKMSWSMNEVEPFAPVK